VRAFTRPAVTRRNKCLELRESQRSLAADVVPCYTYKEFYGHDTFRQGTKIFPDRGGEIINWPQQHYENGVAKNDRTRRRFKGMVRAVKHLENEMLEKGLVDEVPSYLLECLVFNIEDDCFGHDTLYADFRCVLARIYNGTMTDERCNEWVEVNDIKYLFRPSQRWTREQAHDFATRAWTYVGFDN